MQEKTSTETCPTAILLLACPDQVGVVSEVTNFVSSHNGNIIYGDQHTDPEVGVFFQRIEFELENCSLGKTEIWGAFAPVAKKFNMQAKLCFSDETANMGILCSKQGHCLYDLLDRFKLGELTGSASFVASNHSDHKDYTESMNVPFHHLPVSSENKTEQEQGILRLCEEANLDLLIMARYMQVLSRDFLKSFGKDVINIHHSFLPAFPGGKPYHQAYERGVKLIGVTAHYATENLDEGPIIEQDVVRVTHRDSVEDLIRKGKDLEKVVLARAIRSHLEHKILTYNNKTVVFS